MIRAFVAIELPQTVIVSIGKLQQTLAAYQFKIRWVDPRNVHLTLKFLGDIAEQGIDAIADALAQAVSRHAPLSLSARGLGAFPGLRKPRVVWVGLFGQIPVLTALQRDIEQRLARIGYPPENRSFRAHLTIGRAKGPIDTTKIKAAFEAAEPFETAPFLAREVVLFRSDLKPSGAEYTRLRRVRLEGPASR